jgi:murein DD-endopeptidase MepM/ murein hydrolase activator NlpD
MTRHRKTVAHRRGRATALAAAGAAAAVLAVPAGTLAGTGTTGGATPPADGPAPVSSAPVAVRLGPVPFGVPVRPGAQLRSLRCLSGCAGALTARTGARLRVRGRNLTRTDLVVFLGADGPADDVAARPLQRRRTAVDVRVPLGAVAGPVTVADRDGMLAAAVPAPLVLAPRAASPPLSTLAAGPRVEAQVADPRGFVDAAIPPHMTYVVHGTEPAAVTIEVVRASDGGVVTSWPAGTVAPETPQTASWNGLVAGKVSKTGRYAFRVQARAPGAAAPPGGAVPSAPAASGATASQAPPDPTAFMLLGNVFPVRGPHGYGGPAARFGGGRHHQGQDVFAACGTPIVAARGGLVQYRRFQSAAGNYLVVDGERTGTDYAYMHLREPALVAEGERVRTGQLIGHVGATGHADGCHLHLELWSAPGWYSGGSPMDPLPYLLGWDRTS